MHNPAGSQTGGNQTQKGQAPKDQSLREISRTDKR